jgi:hypothetical protein
MVTVALLASVSCVVNFFVRLVRHGWKGLGGWEKAVAYIAISGALSPLILDFAFWAT